MATAIYTPRYTCAQCGNEFTGRKRKYCGDKCNWQAASRRKGKRPLDEVRAEQRARTRRECPECKRMFRITRHDRHSKGPQVYCSTECRYAEKRRLAFIAAEKEVYRQWAKRAKARMELVVWGKYSHVAQCECGSFYEKAPWVRRCKSCRDHRRNEAVRKSRRIRKPKERARLRAARVESVDPLKVFERDGWKCHLCHRKTPSRLRGTYHDAAPELDHIIPLSRGGEHSYANTACACRKCNGKKGATVVGQPSLFAA